MKRSIAPLLFGIVFILAGLGYVGAIFFDWDFNLFFAGWWTLFIIVPSFISMLANGPRSFNTAAFIVGILLLLSAQNIISDEKIGLVITATIIIYIGLTMIIHFIRGPKVANNYTYVNNNTGTNFTYTAEGNTQEQATSKSYKYRNSDTSQQPNYNAILSGIDAKNTSTDFQGAKISAILGGVDLDLRDAIITRDITIYATAIMGGIDILAPQNVRIAVNKTDILGGTSCKAITQSPDSNVPLVTFVCTTIMAGIDIK